MRFLPGQFSLAVLSHSLSKIQRAQGSLLSGLMSSLHRRRGLPSSPAPTLERLAFLQNSAGFSSNICQPGNEYTLRKLWTFEDHLYTVGKLSSPSSSPLSSLHSCLPPRRVWQPRGIYHHPPRWQIISPFVSVVFLMCFDLLTLLW